MNATWLRRHAAHLGLLALSLVLLSGIAALLVRQQHEGEALEIVLPVSSAHSQDLTGEKSPTRRVNVNIAGAWELESLPGIGPVKAQAIVDYRSQNGPFLSTEDLMEVKGIGPATYEKLKDLVSIE